MTKKQVKYAGIRKAFSILADSERKIVRAKSLQGEYTPKVLLDYLGNIKRYTKTLGKYQITYDKTRKTYDDRAAMVITIVSTLTLLAITPYALLPKIRYIFHGVWFFMAVLLLGWVWWKIYWQRMNRKLFVQVEILDFLLPLLLILADEVKPGTKAYIQLNLDKRNRKKHVTKVDKNYLLLPHRVILRGFWLVMAIVLAYFGVGLLGPKEALPLTVPFDFLPVIVALGAFVYIVCLGIASYAFGKNPKLKTRLLDIPQLFLKIQLADGTLLQLEINHLLALKTAFKKRKYKVKKKYKVKTITHLKLAFPTKQYGLEATKFSNAFERKPRILGEETAKVKVKTGEKKKVVAYREGQDGKGPGHKLIDYPKPQLNHLIQLVMEGGYNKLRVGYLSNIAATTPKDRLTKIKGLGKATEEKLNGQGVFTFWQITQLDKEAFQAVLERAKIPGKHADSWWQQARNFVNK